MELSIARHTCRARIETAQPLRCASSESASPGTRAGRGLKHETHLTAHHVVLHRPAHVPGAD